MPVFRSTKMTATNLARHILCSKSAHSAIGILREREMPLMTVGHWIQCLSEIRKRQPLEFVGSTTRPERVEARKWKTLWPVTPQSLQLCSLSHTHTQSLTHTWLALSDCVLIRVETGVFVLINPNQANILPQYSLSHLCEAITMAL